MTPDELQNLWDSLPTEQKDEYTQRAIAYIDKMSWCKWDIRNKEDQQRIIYEIMRTDAPLTEKGRNEARDASRLLAKYLKENYPSCEVSFYTSALLRAYETASVIIAEWMTKQKLAFVYDPVVHAGFRVLNELHREIGSAFHMLGTPGRCVAETLGLNWEAYAPYILKGPPTEDELAVFINAYDSTEMWKLKKRVEHVVNENVPMDKEKRPTTLHGVIVEHYERPRVEYPDGCDLFSALSDVRK